MTNTNSDAQEGIGPHTTTNGAGAERVESSDAGHNNDHASNGQGRSNSHARTSVEDVERGFAAFVASAGFGDQYIPADGKWYNFARPGSSKQNMSAVLNYGPNPIGVVKSFVDDDEKHVWRGEPIEFTVKQLAEHERRRAADAAAATIEEENRRIAALSLYGVLPAATAAHPYLVAKQITNPHPLKLRDNDLVLPLHNITTHAFQTLQYIPASGDKTNFPGATTSGACCIPFEATLNELQFKEGVSTIIICEGYATGVALAQACPDYLVICAMSAGNIATVAKSVRNQFPSRPIIVAADNDTATEARNGKNPGVRAANKTARAVINTKVAIPPPGDFDDLYRSQGATAVAELIAAAAVPPPEEQASEQPQQQQAPPQDDGLTEAQRAKLPGSQHSHLCNMTNREKRRRSVLASVFKLLMTCCTVTASGDGRSWPRYTTQS